MSIANTIERDNSRFYNLTGMSALGKRLKQARKAAGLSGPALAKIVGIKQPTIANLERGKSDGTKHIVAIAAACGVSATWLQTGAGDMNPGQSALQAEFAKLPQELQRRALAVVRALREDEEAA